MEFIIEKNIQIPQRKPKTAYPFELMEVGDSFQFPKQIRKTVEASSRYYSRKTGKKFTVKNIGDDVVRIWRTQ